MGHTHGSGDDAGGRLSRLGEFASLVCAVHCMVHPVVMPIAIGAGAAGVFSFLRHELVEWGMVLMTAGIGAFAAWRGLRTHGNVVVVTVMMTATVALIAHALHIFDAAGHADGHGEGIAWTGVLAGIALAVSFFVNNRLCRTCATGH